MNKLFSIILGIVLFPRLFATLEKPFEHELNNYKKELNKHLKQFFIINNNNFYVKADHNQKNNCIFCKMIKEPDKIKITI